MIHIKIVDAIRLIPIVTKMKLALAFSFQPSICRNPVCNNRSRFMLDVNKSKFVDFQKVRIQETQAELPRGSIPRRYNFTVEKVDVLNI